MPSDTFKLNALLLAMLASPTFADDAVERGNQSIEKIVVLGEKTEESLKDVSSSVSVITEEQLKTLQYLSVHDAISEIPNLVVLSGQMPNIRGVSGGAKTRVSTITDGVAEPFMADLTGDTGMWDIEQIEVFRGPQSTSNGRNSIGGAMFIKTKDPTFDWQGAARVGYRSESQYIDSAAAISGPLIEDELAFRLSAQHTDGETYTTPVIHEANPPGFDLNKLNTDRIRAKLLWEPTAVDGLKAMLSYAKNHERGNTGQPYFSGDDPFKYQPINPRNMDTESDTGSIKLDYRISDNFSVDFLLARMNYNWVMDTFDKDPATEQVVSMEESNTTAETKLHFDLSSELYSGSGGGPNYEGILQHLRK
ncbi:TonB-dependent receptor plug domain-containing protein [Shewanella algae]